MIRYELLRNCPFTLPGVCRLPDGYRLDLTSDAGECPVCGDGLRVQWTTRVRPVTICLGKPCIILHLKYCRRCRLIKYPEQYENLVPKFCRYSYDLIVEIGILRLENLRDQKIADSIRERYNFDIPLSTISFLANKFYDYLAASHYHYNADKIEDHIVRQGGYVLHIDGTCEAGTNILFSIIDGNSGIVLANFKMKTENKKNIMELLAECVGKYGQPLAVVCDLSNTIRKALNEVVAKTVPLFICQFHFLENVAENIFKKAHGKLWKLIKSEKLKSQLTSLRRDLGTKHDDKLLSSESLVRLFENPERTIVRTETTKTRRSLAYLLIRWIMDYKVELNGEYFPFSLPDYEFAVRCEKVFRILHNIISSNKQNGKKYNCRTLRTIYEKLKTFFDQKEVGESMEQLRKGRMVFNDVREYLRMQSERGTPLRRQKSEAGNTSSHGKNEISIDDFIENLKNKYEDGPDVGKYINIVQNYFEKYKKRLCGHCILNNNKQYINVNRTNNVMECFFGKFKRALRMRAGSGNLKRQINLMHQDAMLVMNLLNEEYLKIIGCDNLRDLARVFAKCDVEAKIIKNNRKKINTTLTHIPFKILRNQNLMSDFEGFLNKRFDDLFKSA